MKNDKGKNPFGKITYHEENGILFPDVEIPAKSHYTIGKYGNLRFTFLKEHRKGAYTSLLTQNRLNEHLHTMLTYSHANCLIQCFHKLQKSVASTKTSNPTSR